MQSVQALQDRIEALEAILGADKTTERRIREAIGLEPLHAQIIGMLLARDFVTRDGLYTVLYEGRPECEWPDDTALDAQMCKLRRRLQELGIAIEIKTRWGGGWSMSKEDQAKIKSMLASRSGKHRNFVEMAIAGGKVRAKKLNAARRLEIAMMGARARWGKVA